ncbi:zinc ABC transporter substrate-binding protein [soil metagenome]
MKLAVNTCLMFVVAPLMTLVAACVPGDAIETDGRLQVVTTTGMIGDAARRVGGDQIRVVSLMGPGVDPHLYKASEGDVRRIFRAQIIFFNGLHLEARMGEVLEHMGERIRTVAVADQIDRNRLMRPAEFEGAYDPHIWFDVALWMETVRSIRDTLLEEDPQNAEGYVARAEAYLAELEELDQYVRSQALRVPAERRVLITAHDAFNYFGRAYGFEVRGLQGISTAAEAGTADVQGLSEFIASRRIPAIFIESSVSPRAVEAVQAAVRARGFRVEIGGELFSDALGRAGTDAGQYVGMVRHNIDTIVGALLRESPQDTP